MKTQESSTTDYEQMPGDVEKQLGDDIIRLKDYAIKHLQFKIEVEKINILAGNSIHEPQAIIQICNEEIQTIESIDPASIDDDILSWLKGKAKSALEEWDELHTGSDLRSPNPEHAEIADRVFEGRKKTPRAQIDYRLIDGQLVKRLHASDQLV